MLTYIAAQLRLASLTNEALPGDRRRKKRVEAARARGRWLAPEGRTKRSPDRVKIDEFVLLLGLAALYALAGWLLAARLNLDTSPDALKLDNRIWRALLVAWTVGALIAVGKAVSSVLGWQFAGRDEAAVYLQDQLWSATRGELRSSMLHLMKSLSVRMLCSTIAHSSSRASNARSCHGEHTVMLVGTCLLEVDSRHLFHGGQCSLP